MKESQKFRFDSDRKLMSTAHELRGKHIMVVKGAVDVLLTRMTHVRIGKDVLPMTEEEKAKIEAQNMEFSEEVLEFWLLPYREIEGDRAITLEDENDLTFLGLVSMMDPPREESKAAVEECIEAGIKPIMITGDHKVTAAAIAKRIGILKDESEACEGAVIENMSDEELQEFVPKNFGICKSITGA